MEIMSTTTLKWLLCVSSLVLIGIGCASEPERPASIDPSPGSAASNAPNLVPPLEGPYDAMWHGLRGLETLTQPVASGSSGDPRPMIINLGSAEEESLWSVAYTDSSLVRPDTDSIVRPPRDALIDALYDELVVGLSFNPYTKAAQQEVFNYNVDKLYIAGLVGYLTIDDAESGRRCEAANEAYAARDAFATLHHALRALDDDEEWSECELGKLWAMWELDFPGSRAMALEEIEWFVGQGNETSEAREMLYRFRNDAVQAGH